MAKESHMAQTNHFRTKKIVNKKEQGGFVQDMARAGRALGVDPFQNIRDYLSKPGHQLPVTS